jgi:hypothetical protein
VLVRNAARPKMSPRMLRPLEQRKENTPPAPLLILEMLSRAPLWPACPRSLRELHPPPLLLQVVHAKSLVKVAGAKEPKVGISLRPHALLRAG